MIVVWAIYIFGVGMQLTAASYTISTSAKELATLVSNQNDSFKYWVVYSVFYGAFILAVVAWPLFMPAMEWWKCRKSFLALSEAAKREGRFHEGGDRQ